MASRPPANFEKVYENRYYEVWRRRAGMRIARHVPLQNLFDASTTPDCAELKKVAAAGGRGERLIAAERPRIALFDTAKHRISGWVLNQAPQPVRTVTPLIPGTASGQRLHRRRAPPGVAPRQLRQCGHRHGWMEAASGTRTR